MKSTVPATPAAASRMRSPLPPGLPGWVGPEGSPQKLALAATVLSVESSRPEGPLPTKPEQPTVSLPSGRRETCMEAMALPSVREVRMASPCGTAGPALATAAARVVKHGAWPLQAPAGSAQGTGSASSAELVVVGELCDRANAQG